jgi:hypothetical protein
MIDELKGVWKEIVMAYLRYYHSICLKGLRKITENLVLAKFRTEHLANAVLRVFL